MSPARVYILLATYQGESYLAELLRSIQSQSYSDWTLLVRDDGSRDATRQILLDTARQDRRIVIAEDDGLRRGAVGNFSWLLQPGRGRTGPTMSCWLTRMTFGRPTKLPGNSGSPGSGSAAGRDSAPGLLRCRGGRCRAAAGTCLVPAAEPPALRFRPAVEDAAGPQLRAGMCLRRESPAHGTRLAAAGGGRFARLVAGPLCGSAGRVTCLDVPLLEYRRHATNASQAAFWNVFLGRPRDGGGAGRSVGRASCDRSNRPRRSATGCDERGVISGEQADLLKAFCRTVEQPSRWRRLWALHRMGVPAIDWPRRLVFDYCLLRL